MSEVPESKVQEFEEAEEDSWWVCESPECACAYQKSECREPGVCPHCNGEAYLHKPWHMVVLDNPQFPAVPESGKTYRQKIV